MNLDKINAAQEKYASEQIIKNKAVEIINNSLSTVLDVINKNVSTMIENISETDLDDYVSYLVTEDRDKSLCEDGKLIMPFFFQNDAIMSTYPEVTIRADSQIKFSNRFFDRVKSSARLNMSEKERDEVHSALITSKFFEEETYSEYNFLFNDDSFVNLDDIKSKLQDTVFNNMQQKLSEYGLKNITLASFEVKRDSEREYRLNFDMIIKTNNPIA